MALEKGKALVLGRNYCNILTTVRLLGEAGYASKILKVHKTRPGKLKFLRTMAPDSKSRYLLEYREVVASEESTVDEIIKMAEGESKKMLLLPVDDYSVYVCDEAYDKLKEWFVIGNINDTEGEINRLMDKSIQKEEAGKLGLNILKNWTVKSEGGSYVLPEGIIYPCFIKPNVSMASTKDRMKRCDSEDELRETLDKYLAKGPFDILIEEFADIKQEYSLLGVATDTEAIAPGIFKATLGGHHERKGVAVTGVTVDPDLIPYMNHMVKGCCQLVKALGYEGIFDIDLIETKDGQLYFVEVNFRAGASIYAFRHGSENLIGAFADYMLQGEALDKDKYEFEKGKTFVSEKVLMEEYVRGDLSKKDFDELMAEADIGFVQSDEDPAPFKEFKKYYIPAALLRAAYKVKG